MFNTFFRKKTTASEPHTVASVNVGKYCGTWYEIASYAPKEEKGCRRTKAEYTLNAAGYVDVRNSCLRGGRERSVRARAYPVPGSGNAKLVVRFFRFIKGDYWVVDLADDYFWAAVSTPTSRSLWILSRTPYMEDEVYDRVLAGLTERGFDTDRLVKTVQRD